MRPAALRPATLARALPSPTACSLPSWRQALALGLAGALLLPGACGGESESAGTGGGAAAAGAGGTGGSAGQAGGGHGGDDWLALCARTSACLGADNSLSLGDLCTLQVQQAALAGSQGTRDRLNVSLLACYRQATSCEAARACAIASADERSVCPGTDNRARCSGETAVQCTSEPAGTTVAYDCAAAGLVCAEGSYEAGCGTQACDPGAAGPATCLGDSVVWCEASTGTQQIDDCRYSQTPTCSGPTCTFAPGGTCGAVPSGGVDCVGTGAECDPATFPPRCEGSAIVSCRNGRQAEVDCPALMPGTTCAPANVGAFLCLLGAECIPGEGESCAGPVAHVCANGLWTDIDCRQYGASGCEAVAGGAGAIVRCVL